MQTTGTRTIRAVHETVSEAPYRQGELGNIWERFDAVEKEVGLLRERFELLQEKLASVLAPGGPTADEGGDPRAEESPQAQRLRGITHRVIAIRAMIDSTLDRLEL